MTIDGNFHSTIKQQIKMHMHTKNAAIRTVLVTFSVLLSGLGSPAYSDGVVNFKLRLDHRISNFIVSMDEDLLGEFRSDSNKLSSVQNSFSRRDQSVYQDVIAYAINRESGPDRAYGDVKYLHKNFSNMPIVVWANAAKVSMMFDSKWNSVPESAPFRGFDYRMFNYIEGLFIGHEGGSYCKRVAGDDFRKAACLRLPEYNRTGDMVRWGIDQLSPLIKLVKSRASNNSFRFQPESDPFYVGVLPTGVHLIPPGAEPKWDYARLMHGSGSDGIITQTQSYCNNTSGLFASGQQAFQEALNRLREQHYERRHKYVDLFVDKNRDLIDDGATKFEVASMYLPELTFSNWAAQISLVKDIKKGNRVKNDQAVECARLASRSKVRSVFLFGASANVLADFLNRM